MDDDPSADDLAESVRAVADSLAATGPHSGWAIGEALARCADAWTRELTGPTVLIGHEVPR